MQPTFLPAIILLFFFKFPFSCVQYLLAQLSLPSSLPSLLPVSSPKRCKLAKTSCISQNCDEICLKTPKSGRNARVFAKFYAKVDKSAQFELKNTFLFLLFFVVAKISLFHVQKHTVFSKIGIQSMWKHLIQLKRSFLSKIWAKNA